MAAQVALTLPLLAGAALLIRTFHNLSGWRPGFDTEHVMVAWTSVSQGRYPDGRMVAALTRQARDAVRGVPGVTGVGGVSNGPLFGGEEPGTFRTRGPGAERSVTARWYDASDGYVETMGLGLLRGRAFTADDGAGAPPVAVVNETFARRMWPGEDPVGRDVALDETGATVREVVGVLRDVPPFRTGEAPSPELWWPFDQAPRWGSYLVVRTNGAPGPLARVIRDRARTEAPALEIGVFRTLPELIERRLVSPRFHLAVVTGFAILALATAVMGLYGLVSVVVSLRLREFAIRRALGTSEGRIRGSVIRLGLGLVGLGAGRCRAGGRVGAGGTGRARGPDDLAARGVAPQARAWLRPVRTRRRLADRARFQPRSDRPPARRANGRP